MRNNSNEPPDAKAVIFKINTLFFFFFLLIVCFYAIEFEILPQLYLTLIP